MQIRTFRADTIHEALALVRRELGPSAAVLHTREVAARGLLGFLSRRREIEVTAATSVNVPSRMARILPRDAEDDTPAGRAEGQLDFAGLSLEGQSPTAAGRETPDTLELETAARGAASPTLSQSPPARTVHDTAASRALRDEAATAGGDASGDPLQEQLANLQEMVEQLARRLPAQAHAELPDVLFRVYTDLIEADLPEEIAREFVERLRSEQHAEGGDDPLLLKMRIAAMLESEIRVAGPIQLAEGKRRVVALVGPTGVGKTTTIAKLAANFRLRARREVGLITVDTYRIAAVEQLRTYADIIDLPMQVVSTPREMRQAVEQMQAMDLVLIDTAGRSPRDEVKIQELRALLAEAQADEVHLVLSSVAGAGALETIARRFAVVGTSALLLTKLDESTSLGNVLPVLRRSKLPLSYLTNGQNVPDDIEAANPARLAREIIGLADEEVEPLHGRQAA